MTTLASEYAEYYEIDPQAESETDERFRSRVAEALREQGHIIEAHEAYQDERYETSEDVMTGAIGAMAQAVSGTNYSGSKIGNDVAAGLHVKHHKDKPELTPEMAILMINLFG